MTIDNLPASRDLAARVGSVAYFTGSPCKNGHVDKRYTNTGVCYECNRQNNARHNAANDDWLKEQSKKQYKKHREAKLDRSKKWASENPDRVREHKRKNKELNRDKYLEAEKERQKNRRRSDPVWRLNRNTSVAIWRGLKADKSGSHWEELVEFTLEELVEHLEYQFRDGMTWGNYGSYWHVDHKKPLAKCSSHEEAWKLANLQPLTAEENLRKGDRYQDVVH